MSEPKATFASFDEALEKAVKDGVFVGAVAFARNKTGDLKYSKAVGKTSLEKGSTSPMQTDTIFRMASTTKLMTSIATMQIVERGLIGLDDDLSHILPLLADQEVIVGKDEQGNATTKKRQNKLTLRLLLTHSAGCAYDGFNPIITKWRKAQGKGINRGATMEERSVYPLTFEPGTSWEYGTNIDWAGKVVEHFSGETLDDYFQKHICAPLGIKDITFWPHKHPGMEARLAKLTIRPDPNGQVVDYNGGFITDGAKDCFGGHGGYGDLSQYVEILQSLLSDDERLLKKATAASMFKPQLPSEESRRELSRQVAHPDATFIGEFKDTGDYDWGLGGLLIGSDAPGWRKKGRMIWSGLPNLFWYIDREAGTCGIFGTQVIPPGDKQIMKILTHFERAVSTETDNLHKANL